MMLAEARQHADGRADFEENASLRQSCIDEAEPPPSTRLTAKAKPRLRQRRYRPEVKSMGPRPC